VAGLRDPQINPEQLFGVNRNVTVGGKILNVKSITNKYRTKLTINSITDKMAEVGDFLSSNRGEPIRLMAGNKYYLWGASENDGGEDFAYLLDKDFIMTHRGYNLWSVPVQLQRVSQTKEHEA